VSSFAAQTINQKMNMSTAKLITFLLCIISVFPGSASAQGTSATISGRVIQAADNAALPDALVSLQGTSFGASTNDQGSFSITGLPAGKYTLIVKLIGYEGQQYSISLKEGQSITRTFRLASSQHHLESVEVFGVRNKQPEKLDAITRLPLKPSDQIQSISIVSDRLIQQQGALTITDATRNVPGVYTYATYGNMRQSISSRGFRGIPVLKNGVRVHSDFRGQGFTTDLEGVESIQVLKGANAITMGTAGDLGAPGGIVNIVTKTPKFHSGGYASLRVGSFGQVRPSFDVYGPLNASKTIAFRLNGVYERADGYRAGESLEKFYVNPSIEWRPDEKTSFVAEFDYLNDSRTPDAGTVNLSTTENEIYDLPFDRNLGWNSNRAITKNTTFALRFKRELNDKLYIRAAFFNSFLDADAVTTTLAQFTNKTGEYTRPANFVQRAINHNGSRTDKNNVLQLDLVGKDVETGFLKHTFQVGFDYRSVSLNERTYKARIIDTVDIFQRINNKLPDSISEFAAPTEVASNDVAIGLMAQDVITVTNWAKVFLGARFSSTQSTPVNGAGTERTSTINPLAGLMVSPVRNINLFASYTNSTNPRSASYVDKEGNTLGSERIDQVEAGLKSDWLNNRLRFNVTFYKINNRNMNIRAVETDPSGVIIQLPYYFKGGNDERKGVEVELAGRVLPDLEVIAGYAFIDAEYKEHTTFVPGSKPNNTPDYTANLWVNYAPREGALSGFSIGAGAYHISGRPNNDWTQKGVDFHAIVPGKAPWNMKPYTTVNAQIGYRYKAYELRVIANNLLDEVGYNAYRTSFINRIDPRNFAAIISYRF